MCVLARTNEVTRDWWVQGMRNFKLNHLHLASHTVAFAHVRCLGVLGWSFGRYAVS